jgi:serine/threonine-protein kinase
MARTSTRRSRESTYLPRGWTEILPLTAFGLTLGLAASGVVGRPGWPHLVAALASVVVFAAIKAAHTRRRKAPARPSAVGNYQLVERIAVGGMGEVWRARHSSLARMAAVKLVGPHLLGGRTPGQVRAVLGAFEREAQATASLRSPHTVQLYDFGKTEDGSLYYVMELLEGLDLAALVQRFGPQPAERVVHILSQICHSLEEAHRIGIVHRDIKPANVQLTVQGGDFDVVKVLDFGLAKQQHGDRCSLDDAIRGTPSYLAPEAIRREGGVDARADLYSLGCVAYRLLTGTQVFDGTTVREVMRSHVDDLPLPPSLRLGEPLPPALERLVLRLLSKDPQHRPASAAEVSGILESIRLDQPWTQARAKAWWTEQFTPSAPPAPPPAPRLQLAIDCTVPGAGPPVRRSPSGLHVVTAS